MIFMPAKFDFHTHTLYSDGAGTVASMVEAAEARGLKAVALTDHGFELSMGIPREKLAPMLQDIGIAREDAGIQVLAGLEANVVDEWGTIDVDDESIRKLDILLVAIHKLGEARDPSELARDYLRRATNAIERHKFDVFVHPFYFHHYLAPHLLPEDLEDFVRLAAGHEVAIEINIKYRTPDEEFLRLCLREGVKLSVGTDAHTAGEVGRVDWALGVLRRVGARREDLILGRFLR
ncbi:MAG: PHP domain-containing protein [Hadesarchaea archaeon]|nr:MAG: PHP domain-containing protein [Hadesarchaea archaeon]